AAGRVIWAFSDFVASGSIAVGVILFAILVIVQFIVITKGAARISEVAARFVLDAMPGKQMAIDSDLKSALIDEAEARRRRKDIAREMDFYGAMDGASKFLRGDAIAAVIITMVNILGGLYVGTVQQGWSLSETVALFTRLTIGDGLVTQIPAFIICVSAALAVTRPSARTNLGEETVSQLLNKPIVLVITAVFLGMLALTSLPKIPLCLLGAGCVVLAWTLFHRARAEAAGEDKPSSASPPEAENVEQLLTVDPMRLELGYALVKLVDASRDGDLMDRVAAMRRQVAVEMGFLVPPIRIRDNLRQKAHAYTIKIRGARAASGRLYPSQVLAVSTGVTNGKLVGRQASDPASGTPAVWIGPDQAEHAEMMGYAVVEPADVLMTHLAAIIRRHAGELLSRQHVARLLERLEAQAGKVVAEAREKLKPHTIQKVLQNLLRERVPICDLEIILEVLTEYAEQTDDTDVLTKMVRSALARTLAEQYTGRDGKVWCVSLAPDAEEAIGGNPAATNAGIAPPAATETTGRITKAIHDALKRMGEAGHRPVVLCSPATRAALSRLIAPAVPDAAVLGYDEINTVEVKSVECVGIET
ncbi:MAG: flagellar biosynthesis protein FlhA, partial [Planctomycetota bacterium]|nr:flagellar biosynthesis protein FlhA [Planctomycetota bacterium]